MAAFCNQAESAHRVFVRPKGVCTLCTGRFLTCIFVPFLLVLPVPLHAGLCCRRHDFAARIVGFPGRSGFNGNVFGVIYGWCRIRGQSPGVWDPDSSYGAVLVWLIS